MILSSCLVAQIPGRYSLDVFAEVNETNNVLFSTAVPQPVNSLDLYTILSGGLPLNVKEYNITNVDLRMDIFEPSGDTLEKRPLVIICFGGGFLRGSRDYWSIRLLAQGLARMGYVTASIDYRLGMNIFDKDIGARSVYRAIQDSRSAIRYFKADADNSNTFKIDTDNIFIGGHSSGAFMALHNVYLDKEIERPISTFAWSQDNQSIPDLGCLDCVGDNQAYAGNAKGVFSLAGALGALSFIEDDQKAPPILFHSSDDGTVPYNSGEPFADFSFFIIGDDLPFVYGSLPTSKRCDTLGLPYQFNSYSNRGHGVHENGSMTLHSDILPDIGSWFYEKYLKPSGSEITGESDICANDLVQDYDVVNTEYAFYDWQLIGGTLVNGNANNSQVSVAWDDQAPLNRIELVPYTCNGAAGEKLTKSIGIQDGTTNSWLGGSGSWTDPTRWSKDYSPLPCENVVIAEEVTPTEIQIGANEIISILSLVLGNNIALDVASSAQLEIKP